MLSTEKNTKRKLGLLHILGVILFVIPGVFAAIIWTIYGVEDGSRILFETPVAIPFLISFISSFLILLFVFVRSLLAAYRSEGG